MTRRGAEVPAVRVAGLTKDFPLAVGGMRLRAVDNLSLSIAPGQVYGLLGPNGSGKSTTIKALLGLLRPTAGTCAIFGAPSSDRRSRVDVGYLPESPDFYRFLTGLELVRFCGRLCGLGRREVEARAAEVIARVGMTAAASRRLGTYSKGMLQRIGLAQALVHDPRLVILDEPTAGVDPVGSAEIADLIADLKRRGKTILLSSHLLAQVETLCDRIAILDRGRLVLEGAVADLVGEKSRDALIVENLPAGAAREIGAWLAERGGRLVAVERPRVGLDAVFLRQVRRGDGAERPGPGRDA